MESTRVSARLAGYVEAISEAREAGITWRQIGELFGVQAKTAAAAYKIARQGRYKVHEQKPLPELPDKRRQQGPVQQVKTTVVAGQQGEDYGGFDKPKPKRVFDDDK